MKKKITLLLSIFYCCLSQGNNLQIGPITLTSANGSQYLNFTIGWNNSWRVTSGPGNWDAVWIFVKRRDCSALDWRHVNLAAQDTAHTAGAPLLVDAYADRKGVMIYRVSDGSGSISNVNIQLKLDSVPAGNYDYQVFGIEMVYVPQGSFYLGDGVSTNTFKIANSFNPFLVTSESQIPISNAGVNLYALDLPVNSSIPSTYPKGYNSFYCMKYEVSQGQYVDFLNNIAQDAVVNRFDALRFGFNRFTISGIWPSIVSTAPNRACNWLSFKDLLAYLDWAALSPMTELEFEKICRGAGNIPLANEYAWGSSTATDADSILAGTDGLPGETSASLIATGSGLANFGNDFILGPMRCGFAAKTASTRFEAGASFYGVMELSGNLYERCYNVYSFGAGINFSGNHGDGEISVTPSPGFANQGWPVELSISTVNEVNAAVAFRGGAWISNSTASELKISDRSLSITNSLTLPGTDLNGRGSSFGGRGVSRRQQ